MKACAYCRVSTEEQIRGLSLGNQESKIKSFCESQGWQLTEVYSDPGYSGKDLNRPGVSRMIEDIRNKKIDVCLVYKVDRLSRKQKDLWHLLEDVFEPNKVGFKSVVEPFDTTTAQGRAFLGMLSVFAQLERDQTRERIKDALAHKKTRREWIGHPPYGYKILKRDDGHGEIIKDKFLTIDEQQAEIVKMIFHQRKKGKTLQQIMEKIIALGINSRKWSVPLIHGILKNPVYLGGIHRGIISKKLFDRVQCIFSQQFLPFW